MEYFQNPHSITMTLMKMMMYSIRQTNIWITIWWKWQNRVKVSVFPKPYSNFIKVVLGIVGCTHAQGGLLSTKIWGLEHGKERRLGRTLSHNHKYCIRSLPLPAASSKQTIKWCIHGKSMCGCLPSLAPTWPLEPSMQTLGPGWKSGESRDGERQPD